jgi:hypothetical protein
MGCRKIDVIEFIAMARERGRGALERDNRFAVNRSETRCRRSYDDSKKVIAL